jgi:hypothetical protein
MGMVLCAALGAVLGAISPSQPSITWQIDGWPIITVHRPALNRTIQLGCRSDGVVVWREITQSVARTNSPAESGMVSTTNVLYPNHYNMVAPIEGMSTNYPPSINNPLDPHMTPPWPIP